MVSSIWSGETSCEGSTELSWSSVTKPRALAVLISRLTAASDRSSSGLSFSCASACGVVALRLGLRSASGHSPERDGPRCQREASVVQNSCRRRPLPRRAKALAKEAPACGREACHAGCCTVEGPRCRSAKAGARRARVPSSGAAAGIHNTRMPCQCFLSASTRSVGNYSRVVRRTPLIHGRYSAAGVSSTTRLVCDLRHLTDGSTSHSALAPRARPRASRSCSSTIRSQASSLCSRRQARSASLQLQRQRHLHLMQRKGVAPPRFRLAGTCLRTRKLVAGLRHRPL